MRFEGIHHITLITGDAARNVDFYTRVLGLRLVKKTVNQDDPTVYHLFYADERGSAGSDITFFEYPGARRGRAGAGMVHTITWRVSSEEALDFWERRLKSEAGAIERAERRLRFEDPEGVGLELAVVETSDEPLVADHPEIAPERALQGIDGVRAFGVDPERSRRLFEETLGFEPRAGFEWEVRGERRGGWFTFEPAPDERGVGGAGTVHHVAFASTLEEHEAWQRRVAEAGMQPTPVIDRFYFKSVYFREPNGVLFELATLGPGFATDEDPAHLGERLSLPPAFEHLRERIEPALTKLPNPRAGLNKPISPPVAETDAGTIAGTDAGTNRRDGRRDGRRDAVVISHIERPAAGEPEGALVLFHGRGADERDLYPLLDALDPERRLLGLTPRGPLALPPGGAHWYALGGIPTPDPASFWPSFEAASAWLDELPVPLERTVLGGFSQGAVMSWALGLGRGAAKRPAGIVALSGFLPVVEGLELDVSGLDGFPVAIGHGTFDEIISARFSREAKELVEPAGADHLYREYPLPHAIDPAFLPDLAAFVQRAVATK